MLETGQKWVHICLCEEGHGAVCFYVKLHLVHICFLRKSLKESQNKQSTSAYSQIRTVRPVSAD